ncbi:MAG: hypothetical protein ACJ8AM_08775 [Gemmatimonadales bacterium]
MRRIAPSCFGCTNAPEPRTCSTEPTGWPPSGPTPSSASCFQEYLDASTFQAWDDIVPPRIKISPDGQMAYAIVQKRVHLTANDSTGKVQPERTRFAWLGL